MNKKKLKFVKIIFDTPVFDRITRDSSAKFVDMLSAIGGTMGLLTHYDSKHRKMFRQILKATGNTPIHRILMQMHDIKYIYCHFCRKQGRRLQGQAQGIKMTNNK